MQVPARLPGQGHIPQNWALPLGKDITTAFKGFAEILTRTAEPIMRYATVYLAIATALPVLRWEPLYYVAMIIVIASPEFVLVGALSIAEAGFKEGRKGWSIILFIVCGLLSIIMTVTFMEVFKILSFTAYIQQILNFARCMVAAGFSVVLPKLDGVSSQNQVVQTPDYQQLLLDMRTQIQSEIVSSLATLRNDLSAQIDAKIGTLETTLSAQIPQVMSVDELALQLAPLLQIVDELPNDQSVLSGEQIEDQEVNDTPNKIDQNDRTDTEQLPNAGRLHLVNKTARSQRTIETSEAAKKIKRLLRKDRTIGPTELASKCGCSKSYASTVKQQFLREQPA